jgi:hypothetical protein
VEMSERQQKLDRERKKRKPRPKSHSRSEPSHVGMGLWRSAEHLSGHTCCDDMTSRGSRLVACARRFRSDPVTMNTGQFDPFRVICESQPVTSPRRGRADRPKP